MNNDHKIKIIGEVILNLFLLFPLKKGFKVQVFKTNYIFNNENEKILFVISHST